ncbi:MAG TPA: hypothetical protein VFQ20_11005 [Burkholderiaceae bacterium]|nr:hypothetical protein [Burkholderiaceae bacterium]
MNKFACRALVCATLTIAAATPALAAVDVGVGVTIREPGVYGRIEIGNAPPPLLYPQPVIITQPRVVVAQPPQPLYLYVPPGHAKKWDKHCHKYNACARPVYFVQETWVQQRWEQEHRGKGHGKNKGKGKGKHDD